MSNNKESWVNKDTVRVTTNNGRTSYLYRSNGFTRTCIEVADHDKDKTTAYEANNSVIGQLFHGGRGKPK